MLHLQLLYLGTNLITAMSVSSLFCWDQIKTQANPFFGKFYETVYINETHMYLYVFFNIP